MRPLKKRPIVLDSLSKDSFFSALVKHIEVMKKSSQVSDPMIFGERRIEKNKYVAALQEILKHNEDWQTWIYERFDFFEVYGQNSWAEVMSTGYYEPIVRGSYKKNGEFSQALMSTPNDLITLNFKNFPYKFSSGEHLGALQGRIVNQKFVPYFSRKEIDSDNILNASSLAIAWVDPLDAFFIQIQGSGVIVFDNGDRVRVGYDSQNGLTYAALGKLLKNIIPADQMSMQSIKAHLKTLAREEQQKILNYNPSYVFFKKLDSNALTFAGMEVSAGRTIATDLRFFPKGALAFLDIEEPQFDSPSDIVPKSWQRLPRFVFDQDTGGAIKGGGRVDLYFGSGDVAAQKAGVMKQKGLLYYLVPRN
ncbi:MAG: MltA domain-containing protein [Bacteriovorax sp.]|nr:MltA domain-containing protein [Bacteriovorax sp.]